MLASDAHGRKKRMAQPFGTWCGPSSRKGSALRAASRALMRESRSVRGRFSAEAAGKGIGLKLSEGNDDSPTVRPRAAQRNSDWLATKASVNTLVRNGKFPH